MFGFNWIDLIILLLLIGSVVASLKLGIINQVFVLGGFFIALFAGGWLFHRILPIHDRTLLTIVNSNLVLIGAIYGAFVGYDFSQRLHWSHKNSKYQKIDTVLGPIVGIAASLLTVWLLTTTVSRFPFVGLSNSTSDSRISQFLVNELPNAPALFATFNNQINPNNAPYVFNTPRTDTEHQFSMADFNAASTKAAASTVQVTGFGCGGTVSGSGFAIGTGLLATNAHIVAGVKRPIIKYNEHSFEAFPVYFDANADLAILRAISSVHKFDPEPLLLANFKVETGATVAMLGYPGDKFSRSPGVLTENYNLLGRNIYDMGLISRDVYIVQTRTSFGNSGGPIVLPDGLVAGIVFAKWGTGDDYAYALTSPNIVNALKKAELSYRRVGQGSCMAN